MAAAVPLNNPVHEPGEGTAAIFAETLDGLLELTGAAGGWIGLVGLNQRLAFPVRRGAVSDTWLAWQQGNQPLWGFEIREGPTLLNEVPALAILGEPALRNLLSCPLHRQGAVAGQIVLANKANGFTSHDAAVLQTSAHLLGKYLTLGARTLATEVPASWLRFCAEHASEGILIFDENGTLVFANEAWCRWTGYAREELCRSAAPFPFWLSHRDLAALVGTQPVSPDVPQKSIPVGTPGMLPPATPGRMGYLPFRRRDRSLFWCQAETIRQMIDGREVTVAFLRRLPDPRADATEHGGWAFSFPALLDQLPCCLVLTDRDGQVLWANRAFAEEIASPGDALGHPIQIHFTTTSALALQRLIRPGNAAGPGRGCLLLQQARSDGSVRPLLGCWQTVDLASGPGLLLALVEDWSSLWGMGPDAIALGRLAHSSVANGLALLLSPGGTIEFWDERWQQLTGWSQKDLAGVASETILDWLFPQQRDRELVADFFHQPERRGAQALLEVAGRQGRQVLSCTFLPVKGLEEKSWLARLTGTGAATVSSEAWLLLVSEPPDPFGEEGDVSRYVRQFTRGLTHLLNNYLTAPIGLTELATQRSDLPLELAQSLNQIHEGCTRAGRLLAVLQDLGLEDAGDRTRVSLAAFVQEFLEQFEGQHPQTPCPWHLEIRNADLLVEVNPRLLAVILGHLLRNAVDAVAQQDQRRIDIRVYADEKDAYCEIQDNGPGLPVSNRADLFAPFSSTKGPFALEAADAAREGTGLGLTIARHLAILHGGRLELRSQAQGTIALLALPRWIPAASSPTGAPTAPPALRTDAPVRMASSHAQAPKTR